jgi:hypothetical protein
MRIHLTGSSRNPDEDLPYLRRIIDILHRNNVSIALNWVEAAHHRSAVGNKNGALDWSDIVALNVEAISRSDALIIEGTTHGFFQGFQAAIALERRRPVLFLSREPISGLPVGGIQSKLLTTKHYADIDELEKIVKGFLKDYSRPNKQLNLSEQSYRFLRGESLLAGKTEAELVDSLINERLKR